MILNEIWSDGEVDLSVLFNLLWVKKLFLAVCLFISLFIGACIIHFSSTKWVSHAKLYPVDGLEYTKISSLKSSLLPHLSESRQDELMKQTTPNAILNKFISNYQSYDNRKGFIENNETFKALFLDNNIEIDSDKYNDMLDVYIKGFKYSNVDDNVTGDDIFIISSESGNEGISSVLLKEYFHFVNEKTINYYNNLFESSYQLALDIARKHKVIVESSIDNKVKSERIKMEKAYDIAESVNIVFPLQNINQDDFFPYMLGTKVLKEKISIYNSENKSYYLAYSDYRYAVDEEYTLKNMKLMTFNAVKIVEPIFIYDGYIIKKGLSKILTLLASMLIGLVIGIFMIIIKSHNEIKGD